MTDDRHRKRPQRVHLACLPCRQGKLRCDRESPCNQCIKRAREATCSYTERGLRYNAAKQKEEYMREKVDRLESFVNQLRQSSAERPDTNSSHSEAGRDTPAVPAAIDLSQAAGKLRIAGSGSTQYVGPSHWESIIEDIAEVKAYFDYQSSPESQDEQPPALSTSEIVSVDIPLGVPRTYSTNDILALLPEKAVMDRMVAAWFHSMDGLKSILHGPTFQRDYQEFWRNPVEVSPAWLALLVAVASLGAEITGASKDPNLIPLAEDLHRLTAHAFVLADYAKPQAYIIESLIFYIKWLLLRAHDVTAEAHLLFGLVTRLCTQAGYHKDPKHNASISPLNAEMRRRVWASVQAYDIKMCYQLGLVSVVNYLCQDTALPSNLTDGDLDMDPVPPARPLHEQTPMTFAIVFSHYMRIMGDINASSHAVAAPNAADIAALDSRLNQARNDLPPQLRMQSLEDSILDPPELILARYGLEFQYLKSLCVLYQRFTGKEAHGVEKRRCIDAADGLVKHQVTLLRAMQPGGPLEASMVLMRQLIHDFNLAAMLLCLHIKRASAVTSTPSDAEHIERMLSSIIEGCQLWEQSGSTSAKARYAYRAIYKFVLQQASSRSVPVNRHIDWETNNEQSVADDPGMQASAPYSTRELFDVAAPPVSSVDVASGMNGSDIMSAQAWSGLDGMSIEQDLLFQDLFGPSYGNENPHLDWP